MALIAPKTFNIANGSLVIRSAQSWDAQDILIAIRQTEAETDFLMRVPGEYPMSVDEERRFIEEKLMNPKEVFILAEYNGQLAGTLSLTSSLYMRYRHRAILGISVLKRFWGLGIGKKLIETALEWADANGIVKIALEVDTLNERAIRLYKSFGFFVEGLLKMDRLMENGEFRDSYIMARFNPYCRYTPLN